MEHTVLSQWGKKEENLIQSDEWARENEEEKRMRREINEKKRKEKGETLTRL